MSKLSGWNVVGMLVRVAVGIAVVDAAWRFLCGSIAHPLARFWPDFAARPTLVPTFTSVLIWPLFYVSALLAYSTVGMI